MERLPAAEPHLPEGLTEQALRDSVEELERALQAALATGRESELNVIGFGEITTVLRWDTPWGPIACKRLVPFVDRRGAERAAEVIRSYIDELRGCGVRSVETRVAMVESGRRHVLYCVQPVLAADVLGPEHFRRSPLEHVRSDFRRILELLGRAVTPRLAPDGQLSNWAFPGEDLIYLDVSTPFMRDERGREQFDFGGQVRALPAPLRPIVRRFAVRRILDKYYDLRGQVIDFLGNLVKERLDHLIPDLARVANEACRFSPPVTPEEVARYYRDDARTYAWIQAARRADRWVHRYLLWRTYPYLLPPPVHRFATGARLWPLRGGVRA